MLLTNGLLSGEVSCPTLPCLQPMAWRPQQQLTVHVQSPDPEASWSAEGIPIGCRNCIPRLAVTWEGHHVLPAPSSFQDLLPTARLLDVRMRLIIEKFENVRSLHMLYAFLSRTLLLAHDHAVVCVLFAYEHRYLHLERPRCHSVVRRLWNMLLNARWMLHTPPRADVYIDLTEVRPMANDGASFVERCDNWTMTYIHPH